MISLHFDGHLPEFQRTARALVKNDWGRSFFGNISLMVDEEEEFHRLPILRSFSSPLDEPNIEDRYFLITKASSTMEEVADLPETAVGLYRIQRGSVDLLGGRGPPTSELSAHLSVHSLCKGNAIIHCHMPVLGSITSTDLERSLLPKDISWVGNYEPGSIELALATKREMENNHTIIWIGHGAVTYSDGLDKCLERLHALDDLLRKEHPFKFN